MGATAFGPADVLPDRRHRWFATGRANLPDAADAARTATRQALAGADGSEAKLVIVFASRAYDLTALVSAVNETTGGVPLIGCTTAGEIAAGGPSDGSIVVAVLGGPGFTATTAAVSDVGIDHRLAGDRLGSALSSLAGEPSPNQVMVLLADGLLRGKDEVIRGVYDAVGASIPLVGGFAGDEWRFEGTYLFHGNEVLHDAAVGATIGSDGPIGLGLGHGWHRVGEPLIVTSSAPNRVIELDYQPALDVYRRVLDMPSEYQGDPEQFRRFSAWHPLGVGRRSGEEVRVIGSADETDGSLETWSPVYQGGVVWLMAGDAESVQASTVDACAAARRALGATPPIGALAFDCVGRRLVLGDNGLDREVASIATEIGAPLAGLYTYGEIARLNGPNGFHNQTLVVLTLG